jgi:hypothetical protein
MRERRSNLIRLLSACAVLWSACCPVIAEESKKDAAEAVGEGNAARWLDYYRRERGQQWDPKPGAEAAGKPADKSEPHAPARSDPTPQPDRR